MQSLLNIFFGDMPTAIYNTEVYFKNVYEDHWLLDDFAREVIMGVDKSEVVDSQLIKSPVLGMIPPTSLSGGVKTLILIKNCPEKIFNASTCGDNCAKYILKLAQEQDITINLRHIMNFGRGKFRATILNDGSTVANAREMLSAAARYV